MGCVPSCCGAVFVTGDRTVGRCMDFCRCKPGSGEVEEMPWVLSRSETLVEATWRSVEVELASCRCLPSTTMVLVCHATRMLGSDRTRF